LRKGQRQGLRSISVSADPVMADDSVRPSRLLTSGRSPLGLDVQQSRREIGHKY